MTSDEESTDEIIERVTVDAYGDEGHTSFLCAFEDEVTYPVSATLAGTSIAITRVDIDGDSRRGLVAKITNISGTHRVALTECKIIDDGHAQQLSAAYRQWLGYD